MSRSLRRRDFLRVVGAAAALLPAGCGPASRELVPYVYPPEDVVPGKATWYATTCRECPAGCGVLAKNRDGRVIKVEGNPLHPVNAGKLCVRGQASLHGLYDPDRFRGPMRRNAAGKLEPVGWGEAEALLADRLKPLVAGGPGDRAVFLSELVTGTRMTFLAAWLSSLGSDAGPVLYEPFAYEPLRAANELVFGYRGIPTYRIDRADFLISFGAGFLETWLSNVQYARQFASFHGLGEHGKRRFVYVGPRLSMTANSADLCLLVPPGAEYLVALAILRVALDENLVPLPADTRGALAAGVGEWTLPALASRTGVPEGRLRELARGFAAAERPLALAEGLGLGGPRALEAAVAANLLCTVKPGSRLAIDFAARSSSSDAVTARAVGELLERADRGEVELLLLNRANPVFSLPASWRAAEKIRKVPFIVSFASSPDETTAYAHLVLPTHTPLESWGDYSPQTGVTGLLQPVMGPVFRTRQLEDVLAAVAERAFRPNALPRKNAYQALRSAWAVGRAPESAWTEALERGGAWGTPGETAAAARRWSPSPFTFPPPGAEGDPGRGLRFTAYPTVQFFDGRQANRLWLQEIPDPLTMMTWDGWAELHPETAARLGFKQGDVVRLRSASGVVGVPVVTLPTVPPGTVAMPVGQGHTEYGRFATGRPANPMALFPPGVDPRDGGLSGAPPEVVAEPTGQHMRLAHTDGSPYQHDREIAQAMTLRQVREAVAAGRSGSIVLPLPEGYEPQKDFYPPHGHEDYRWSMVVDLDRCIGCQACVVACYAENNVAVVGKEQVLKGREMSWLRIQRYFEHGKPQARWLPMLCQHCDAAPCEPVCPVYAPHHGREGMNNQIYNRCFGTRFCLQADPYKVRRFNWFTFKSEKPLAYQLNPDVTVRQKGIMEKCSFCIQRVVEAKIEARSRGRKVRDGDFTTACAQTCPTDALIFGNLLDPESRVAKLVKDARAYQVLAHYNTKPAVIYLKKVTDVLEG
ncbi:MAG: 4Fe-4S dicluster domain-containing protein [Deltaproteobacteria bacterium]|nr:4Fe-4S dicluster domain-containing protein [Deltaproteobacteria bacterium]